MLKSKSQVSVFVVIGAIIVLAVAFFFVNSKFEIFVSSDTRAKNQVSEVITECISDNAKTGAYLLGQQGGYIYLSAQQKLDPRQHIDLGVKVPTWDADRGGYPTIDSMQDQLERFIKNSSYSCIKSNLKALEETYEYDFPVEDEFEIDVEINDKNVVIDSELPVKFNVKNTEEVLFVEDYYVKLDDLPLGDLYELAIQVYNVESSYYFLEELILDQIYTSNDYSDPESMPSEGIFLTCGKKVWTIPQLKKNLASLNNNNFRYLYFEGTRPIEWRYDGLDESTKESVKTFYDKQYNFYLDDTKRSFRDYDVSVFMPSQEFTGKTGYFNSYYFRDFEVTPSSGNIVKSMDMEFGRGEIYEVPVPCVQIMHHLYTLDYDLLVRLTDYSDDSEDNFVFQFPLRVYIEQNEPRSNTGTPIPSTQTMTFTEEDYCSNESRTYPQLFVAEDYSSNRLSGVNVNFECMNLECNLGETTRDSYRNPILDTKMPFCVNAKVYGEREGYHGVAERIDSDNSLLSEEGLVDTSSVLRMIELKEYSLDKRQVRFSPLVYQGGSCPTDPDFRNGQIYLTIENEEYDFISEVIYPQEEFLPSSLELLKGEGIAYNLSLLYLGPDSELRGIMEIEDWVPDVNQNTIVFTFLADKKGIETSDAFIDYYDEMESLMQSGGINKCFAQFGVSYK